jgi:hypothetical protein
MTMKTRKKRERDQRDELLDKIDCKGLAEEEVLGRGAIPSGAGAAVHRTHGAQLRAVRFAQGFEGGLRGSESDIPCAKRRGGTGGP